MDRPRHPQVIRTWKVERLKRRCEQPPPRSKPNKEKTQPPGNKGPR